MRACLCVLLLAGCHTEFSVPTTATGGDMSENVDLGGAPTAALAPTPDMAPTADMAPAPSTPDLAAPPKTGSVLLDSDRSSASAQSYVYPVFADSSPATGCTRTVAGACTLDVCAVSSSAATTPRYYDAGTITIAGGLYSITAAPATDGSYAETGDSTRALWNGGERLSISSAGAVVPAFDVAIAAPMPVEVTTPPSSSLSIDRSRDFAFTWTGGSNEVEISIGADGDGVHYGDIDCIVPAAPGSYSVPSSLLAQLPPGTATVIVDSVNQQTVVVQEWTIDAFARSLAVDTNGAGFTADATLQ